MAVRVGERHRGVDKVEVALELSRDRVREGADGLEARVLVLEDGEVGVEELVGLADGDLEREPVTGGRDGLGGDAVLLQPGVDSVDAVLRRSDELVHLWATQRS